MYGSSRRSRRALRRPRPRVPFARCRLDGADLGRPRLRPVYGGHMPARPERVVAAEVAMAIGDRTGGDDGDRVPRPGDARGEHVARIRFLVSVRCQRFAPGNVAPRFGRVITTVPPAIRSTASAPPAAPVATSSHCDSGGAAEPATSDVWATRGSVSRAASVRRSSHARTRAGRSGLCARADSVRRSDGSAIAVAGALRAEMAARVARRRERGDGCGVGHGPHARSARLRRGALSG
jgi:hypothetical protein